MELEESNAARSISLCEPSPSQSHIGRVMAVLLSSRHRHLDSAVRRLGVAPSRSASGSLLDESLCFLWRYVDGVVEKGEGLDEVIVPMIEHSLVFKEPKHSRQVLTLIGWLFRDECFAYSFLSCLVEILSTKKDHFVAHGWCKLVTAMIDVLFDAKFDDAGREEITSEKKQEQEISWLKILWLSISDLLRIVRTECTQIDGFELPTRLAAASSDCLLMLFEALMRHSAFFSSSTAVKSRSVLSDKRSLLSEFAPNNGKGLKSTNSHSHHSVNMEIGQLLWSGLDQLIVLIEKLNVWSQKSQPLHAKGLEQLAKWVQGTKLHYDFLRQEADSGNSILEGGILLLCFCWRHYGRLLRLNDIKCLMDHKEILEQLLAALQFYTNQESVQSGDINGVIGTRKFFLTCISLLLGRLHGKYLQAAISGFAYDLFHLLFALLQDNDEDITEVAVEIIRATLFVAGLPPEIHLVVAHQMEQLLSALVKCLNEHDPAAMATIKLAAEYCFLFPEGQGLEVIFECFEKGSVFQKRNVLNVVSTIICFDSQKTLPSIVRKRISEIMVQCLGEGLVSHNAVLKLFPCLDAAAVLPELLHLVCSQDEKVKLPSSEALLAILGNDDKGFSIFFMFLDYLSNWSQMRNVSEGPSSVTFANYTQSTGLQGEEVSLVLNLLVRSKEKIEDGALLIDKLIDRMFADPSNVIIVRLMSRFCDLLDIADLVLHRVLVYMRSEQELDKKCFNHEQSSTSAGDSFPRTKNTLFRCLCPLLLLRILPLSVYDNLSSSDLYDHMIDMNVEDICNYRGDCVAGILFSRAFGSFDFKDVHKVATELCGRLHPQVLLPVVAHQLDDATEKQNIPKIKACLFALCTSLVARGMTSTFKKYTSKIRSAIDLVLSWPSSLSGEVSKAQHGCIDCLALLICAELRPSESSVHIGNKSPTTEGMCDGGSINSHTSRSPTTEMIIQRLTCDKIFAIPLKSSFYSLEKENTGSNLNGATATNSFQRMNGGGAPGASSFISFRLCMANVLISAYQKVPDSAKNILSSKTLPALISGIEEVAAWEVRVACIQVLFSAVCNLKSTVVPFAFDLLKLAMKALKHGLEKEKIAATKLMMSLMANDEILETISVGLPEAKSILLNVSATTTSPEVRKICGQLMLCMTVPLKS